MMKNTTLKFAFASTVVFFSATAGATGLSLGGNAGVKAALPGVSVNVGTQAEANASADANANAKGNVGTDLDLKGKSSAAVKGAKSKGDEMRNEAGTLHSEAKGEVGKRASALESKGDLKAKTDLGVKADAKAKSDVKSKSDLKAKADLKASAKLKAENN